LTGAKLEGAGKNKTNWSPQVRFDRCVPFIISKKNSEYHSHETEGNKNEQKKIVTLTTVFSLQKARLEPIKKQSNNTFSQNQPLLYIFKEWRDSKRLVGGGGGRHYGMQTQEVVFFVVLSSRWKNKTISEGKFVVYGIRG
jgi:hypothetical protein